MLTYILIEYLVKMKTQILNYMDDEDESNESRIVDNFLFDLYPNQEDRE